MPSIEYQGLKFSGGKFFIILSLIGAIIGGGWSGYRFYDDYLDMKQQVQDFVAPDLSEFDKKIDLAKARLDSYHFLIYWHRQASQGKYLVTCEPRLRL